MNILLALLFSIILFWLTLKFGKLFYSSFKPNILHYALCVIVAIISCVCFTIIFKMNDINRFIKKIQVTVNEQVLSRDTLNNKSNTQAIFNELSQKNRWVSKLISSAIAGNEWVSSTDKLEYVNGMITKLRNKIKSIRNKVIWVLSLFQLLSFGIVGYSASKAGKKFSVVSHYENDYTYS